MEFARIVLTSDLFHSRVQQRDLMMVSVSSQNLFTLGGVGRWMVRMFLGLCSAAGSLALP